MVHMNKFLTALATAESQYFVTDLRSELMHIPIMKTGT